jgi:hypothetical protein
MSGNIFDQGLTRVKTVLTVLIDRALNELIVVRLILYWLVVYSIKVDWTTPVCDHFLVV